LKEARKKGKEMEKSQSQTSPGWTLFARGERQGDRVARCPAGHIHLDYGNLSIRFEDDEFLVFARMVTEAAARLQGLAWPPASNGARPSTKFSLN
jgi:hypothetical protein